MGAPHWIVSTSPRCVSRCARHGGRFACPHFRYHLDDERRLASSERCLRGFHHLGRRTLRAMARTASRVGSIPIACALAWRLWLG